MGLLTFYLRRLFTVVKGEVLVLPSRVVVVLFFVTLIAFPVLIDDPYLIRILSLASIFAILPPAGTCCRGSPAR